MAEVVPHTRRGLLSPGTRVGRYELLRRLARGGMAELYLARASGLHGFEKLCVLKLVLPHLVEDRRFVEMFLHEARTAATLDHPNIAHVTDIGELEGEPFFVMQYVRGRDLRRVAKTIGGAPLPLDVALTVASQVAAGLHYVHERHGPEGKPLGLVHRDVSPANVMIGFDGDVKLVDFGIAKSAEQIDATRTGVIKGKVSYMAPEQCRGDGIDRRTDVFALGILLCEMTTGRRLFRGETDFAIMSKIVDGEFTAPCELRPDYPEALQAIVLRALAGDRNDRYATAAAMQGELEAFAQDQGLRLSSLTLSSFMRELYGEQPNAAGVDPLDEAPTEIRPDREPPALVSSASARPTVIESSAAELEPEPESATTVMLPPAPATATTVVTPSVTVVAPPPVERRDETVVSGVMLHSEPFELDEDTRPPAATGLRVVGVVAVLGLAAALTVFAIRSDEDDGVPAKQPTPAVGERTAESPVEAATEHDTSDRPVPAPDPREAEPEAEPEPEPDMRDEPASDPPPPPKTGERALRPSRSQRTRGTKPTRPRPKRGRGLDDMYPSG